MILEGLFFINDVDVFKTYGVYLCEDKPEDQTNYSALLRPSDGKALEAVNYPERNGETLPASIAVKREPRDVTLKLAIVANTSAEWFSRYRAFLDFIRAGWLTLRLPEIALTFRMHYKACKGYDHLTSFEGYVAGKIQITLREPEPTI